MKSKSKVVLTSKKGKLDIVREQASREVQELHTQDIMSRMMTVQTRILEAEEEIIELKSRLSKVTSRLAIDRAISAGIERALRHREQDLS